MHLKRFLLVSQWLYSNNYRKRLDMTLRLPKVILPHRCTLRAILPPLKVLHHPVFAKSRLSKRHASNVCMITPFYTQRHTHTHSHTHTKTPNATSRTCDYRQHLDSVLAAKNCLPTSAQSRPISLKLVRYHSKHRSLFKWMHASPTLGPHADQIEPLCRCHVCCKIARTCSWRRRHATNCIRLKNTTHSYTCDLWLQTIKI